MLSLLLEIGLGIADVLIDNPVYIWVIGAPLLLLAFGVWLNRRVTTLRLESVRQSQQLAQAQQQIGSLQARISLLESMPTQSTDSTAQTAASAPLPDNTSTSISPMPETELVWELPAQTSDELAKPAASSATGQPTVRPAPSKPAMPNVVNAALQAAQNWLLGGNTVLRMGAVVLFLGLAFLLRYATEGVVVPIETRYAGVAGSAIALLGLGWWLRRRKPAFALMMQGTGVGVLYLTVSGAIRVHELLDPTLGFALLIVVMLFSAMLAITQNSLALACAATLGGFAAPILSSTGQGSHITLFSYFALLNVGVFAIAWFKTWRLLNLIGFFGTFGIGIAWGLRSYTPDLFWSVEPFLILFFLMYLAIGLLFARRKLQELSDAPTDASREAMLQWSRRQGDYVDGTLLFGTPLVGFGLQYSLTADLEFGAAFSALALGMLYMGIARLLSGRAPGRALLLVETCLALGIVFATFAIPLGLGAKWTTSAWAIEGAAIFWLGMRQQRLLARGFGVLLQIAAGLAFIGEMTTWYFPSTKGGDFWTPMIIALAGLFSALQIHRIKTLRYMNEKALSAILLGWGGAWWGMSLLIAHMHLLPHFLLASLLLLSIAISVGLWTWLATHWRWPGLAALCLALIPAGWFMLLICMGDYRHLFANWAWVGWTAMLIVHMFSLHRLADLLPRRILAGAHILGVWLYIVLLSLELSYGAYILVNSNAAYSAWSSLAGSLIPSFYLIAMAANRRWPWPVDAYPKAYRVWAAVPVVLWLLGWFWLMNYYSYVDADPLPYVPVLNPLELGLLFALLGIVNWIRNNLSQLGIEALQAKRLAIIVGGASLFALITGMVFRSPIDPSLLQAALSIVWTLTALALMIGGHLRRQREVWITGAVLIGVVVAKLFLVELSDRGGMARVISFIGVGILLLVVGYFAPLPPKKNTTQKADPFAGKPDPSL
ncbi:DUF2339 domain-containing protein [Pseudomonas caspiana]|uniref:DUF2339 domain-containing protein n=1 Tax=Pseudomonas caspiana TaxID=1451454 RepID=A0A1Y3PBG1_9PSED|nr:DUF2339 domain-containing protein [Pseudomonas caspiana]OUM75901.1 hypothetical protein AUC60_02030 [Pseudomonas caspiana]